MIGKTWPDPCRGWYKIGSEKTDHKIKTTIPKKRDNESENHKNTRTYFLLEKKIPQQNSFVGKKKKLSQEPGNK